MLKSNWELKKLKDVCKQFIVPQRDKPKVFDGDIPWCRIEDFDGRYLYKSKSGKCVSKEVIQSMPLRVYPINTVIVSCSADLGKCAIIKNPLVTNQTFIGLVPSKNLFPEFLYFIMSSKAKYLNEIATGATIKYLSKNKFQELTIPIPPLEEQQAIVTKLDQAFAAIDQAKANIEKNIANAKELFQSKLNQIFSQKGEGWEEKKLLEVCNEITDGSHFSPKTDSDFEYPYITVRDINEDKIDFDNCKFINKNAYETLLKNGCKPFKGDLLFSKDGTVGKVSLVDIDKEFVVLSSLAIIRPKSDIINSSFLKYILKNPKFLSEAIGMKTGVAIRRIILKNLKIIEICYPKSLNTQKQIVLQLDQLQEQTNLLVTKYEQKLANLEELKKSILEKAFKGELV